MKWRDFDGTSGGTSQKSNSPGTVRTYGRYWRMDYRFADKRKTLALGIYPTVSLAVARERREAARKLLADSVDPGVAKQQGKLAQVPPATKLEWRWLRCWRRGRRLETGSQGQVLKDRPAPGTSAAGSRQDTFLPRDR